MDNRWCSRPTSTSEGVNLGGESQGKFMYADLGFGAMPLKIFEF